MRVPTNSSAELIVRLEAETRLLDVKILEAKRSYAEYIATSQQEADKNRQTIAALEEVATWDEIPDPEVSIEQV